VRDRKSAVIAHRGAWKRLGLPQNSIAALRQAAALGCEGCEFDVRLTADGVVVVNHDPHFGGLEIATSTYHQLRRETLSNGERLPRLEEYLRAGIESHPHRLILEIKSSSRDGERSVALAERAVAKVHAMHAEGQVEYISFSHTVLHQILALDSNARVAYLGGDKTPAQLKADKFHGADYQFTVFQAHPEWLIGAHELGLHVNAWTANDGAAMQWLLDAGADDITTDEPELLQQLIEN
jgi:glycerophosphoryl diester phosphodiesterase